MKANEIVDAMLGHCSNDSEDVIKKIIREEVRRWHPDKFKQKIGHRIIDGQSEKVLEEVKRIAQAILSYAKWFVKSFYFDNLCWVFFADSKMSEYNEFNDTGQRW